MARQRYGFVVCIIAWLNRNRRLAKDFEATIENAVAWIMIASIKLLSRRSLGLINHADFGFETFGLRTPVTKHQSCIAYTSLRNC
jgi:hypothetical protein